MTTDLRNENNRPHTRKALGRGLAALLPEAQFEDRPNEQLTRYENTNNSNSYFMCPIDKLIASSQQPRQRFAQEEINELSESIKENGLIQPIIVRKRGNDTYEIIAGERRWRASKQAGLKEVPVIFKEMSDKATLLTALIENIQRADLNAIEEGRAYKQLIDEYNMTQEDVSRKVGKDRSTVTNCLRLLKLPDNIQTDIGTGRISVGHAKLLCSLDNDQHRNKVAQQIVEKDLSVRDTESLINRIKAPLKKSNNINKKEDLFNSIEDNLRQKFHTKVNIKGSYEKGSFVIEYFNKEDFERILGLFFN